MNEIKQPVYPRTQHPFRNDDWRISDFYYVFRDLQTKKLSLFQFEFDEEGCLRNKDEEINKTIDNYLHVEEITSKEWKEILKLVETFSPRRRFIIDQSPILYKNTIRIKIIPTKKAVDQINKEIELDNKRVLAEYQADYKAWQEYEAKKNLQLAIDHIVDIGLKLNEKLISATSSVEVFKKTIKKKPRIEGDR